MKRQQRQTLRELSGNIDYLSNNDEGRYQTIDCKESVFRLLAGETAEPVISGDAKRYYDSFAGVQEDYDTFKGDLEPVIEEAQEEGATQGQPMPSYKMIALLVQRACE